MAAAPPANPPHQIGAGRPKRGRPKGSPNRTTTALKDAILQAADAAGGGKGIVGYLAVQATESPSLFMPLLSKVLPMRSDETHDPAQQRVTRIERIIVHPQDSDG